MAILKKSDLSLLTDEELASLPTTGDAPLEMPKRGDLTNLSDEQLDALLAQKPVEPPKPQYDWNKVYSSTKLPLSVPMKFRDANGVSVFDKGLVYDYYAAGANRAFIIDQTPGIDSKMYDENEDAIKSSFAKNTLGIEKEKWSDTDLYLALNRHFKDRTIFTDPEFASGDVPKQLKMLGRMFAAHAKENAEDFWDRSNKSFVELPTAPQMPDMPLLGPMNPATVAGVYNGFFKPGVEGAATPLGVGLIPVTGGLNMVAMAFPKVATIAKTSLSGLFAYIMGKHAIEEIPRVAKVLEDPRSTTQQKVEAVSGEVLSTAMTFAAGIHSISELQGLRPTQKLFDGMVDKSPQVQAMLLENEAANNRKLADRADAWAERRRMELRSNESAVANRRLMDDIRAFGDEARLRAQQEAEDIASGASSRAAGLEPAAPAPEADLPHQPEVYNSGLDRNVTTLLDLTGEIVTYQGVTGKLIRGEDGRYTLIREAVADKTQESRYVEIDDPTKTEPGLAFDSSTLADRLGIEPVEKWYQPETGTRPYRLIAAAQLDLAAQLREMTPEAAEANRIKNEEAVKIAEKVQQVIKDQKMTPEQVAKRRAAADEGLRVSKRLKEQEAQRKAAAAAAPAAAPAESPTKKGLPQWARDEMVRRGQDPNRPLNDFDLQSPSVREAIEKDPTLTPEEKANLLKGGQTTEVKPLTAEQKVQAGAAEPAKPVEVKPAAPAEPPVLEPPVIDEGPELVGIKNAFVDAERERLGLPPATHGEKVEWKAAVDHAMSQPERAGEQLVNELEAKPRPLDSKDGAVLLREIRRLHDLRENARDDLYDANQSGDANEIARATAQMEKAEADYVRAMGVADQVGTLNAQGLAFRNAMLRQDYSLEQLEKEALKRTKGKPLTPEWEKFVKDTAERYKKTLDAMDAYRNYKSLGPRADEALSRISQRLRESTGASKSFVPGEDIGGLFSRENLTDLAIVGADLIRRGAEKFGDFSSEMIGKFGEQIEPYLNKLFMEAQDISRADVDAKKQADAAALAALEPSKAVLKETGATLTKIGDPASGQFTAVELSGEKADPSAPRIILDPKNARQFKDTHEAVDAAMAEALKSPTLGLDPDGWVRAFHRALNGSATMIPPAPGQLLKWATEPDAFRKYVEKGFENNPQLLVSAVEGLNSLDPTHAVAREGGLHPRMTALHFMWGILSRMLDPYNQEAGWARLTSDPKIVEQINRSVEGTYDLSKDQWKKLVMGRMSVEASVPAGRAATSNANAFHLMLEKYNGRWQKLTDIFNDPTLTGPQMRRAWAENGFTKAGIGHKVVSFNLLTLARRDLAIIDRWQVVNLWMDHLLRAAEERGKAGGSPDVFVRDKNGVPQDTTGAYGTMNTLLQHYPVAELSYALIENAMEKIARDNPWLEKILGHPAQASDIHWLIWNIIKEEPVGHSSLETTSKFMQEGGYDSPTFAQDFAAAEKRTERFSGGGFDVFKAEGDKPLTITRRELGGGHDEVRPAGAAHDALGDEGGPKGLAGRIAAELKPRAQEAMDRLAERIDETIANIGGSAGLTGNQKKGGGLFTTEGMRDLAIVGAYHLANGLRKPEAWATKMAEQFGQEVVPHLKEIMQGAKAIIREESRLNAAKRATQKSTDRLREKMAQGDFTKDPRTPPVAADAELMRLRAENEGVKRDFTRGMMKLENENATTGEQARRLAIGWTQAAALSWPTIFEKLTAAAAARAVTTPLEQAVGYGISKVMPRLAAAAPREGVPNLRDAFAAEGKAIAAMVTTGMKGSFDYLRNRTPELEQQFGEIHVPSALREYLGKLHAMLKYPVKIAEYERSLAQRTAHYLRNGADLSDPITQLKVMHEAYVDSNRAIFMQENWAVKAYQSALNSLQAKSKVTGKQNPWAVAAATAAQIEMPIVKVPSNVIFETSEALGGALVGPARAAWAYYKGIENLSPAEADAIMRLMKKGAIGATFVALGFLNYNKAGGFYSPDRKKKAGDVPVGAAKVGGVEIDEKMQHNPYAQLYQYGATVAQAALSRTPEGDQHGLAHGILAASMGLVEEVPFISETSTIEKYLDERQAGKAFEGKAASIAVPGLVQWTAAQMDKATPFSPFEDARKRTVKKPGDAFKKAIPGLRDDLPRKP